LLFHKCDYCGIILLKIDRRLKTGGSALFKKAVGNVAHPGRDVNLKGTICSLRRHKQLIFTGLTWKVLEAGESPNTGYFRIAVA
jgi:hypothetical protein